MSYCLNLDDLLLHAYFLPLGNAAALFQLDFSIQPISTFGPQYLKVHDDLASLNLKHLDQKSMLA